MDSTIHADGRSGEALLFDARDSTVRSLVLALFVEFLRVSSALFEFEKNSHTKQQSSCCCKTFSLSCRLGLPSPFRFRQEYRIERKLLGSAPSLCDEDESIGDLWEVPLPSSSRFGTRGISRVVVVHNDTLATFSSPTSLVGNSNDECDNCASKIDSPSAANGERASDFFDTPEFWSGSITWW
jgi:hypothetical protein